MESELTRSQRAALREIWRRTPEPGDWARTGDLASALGVSPATATAMVKRLVDQGLADHAPYKGVALTRAGRTVATSVVRRHRIVERFLSDMLGYNWAEADRLAPQFEHDLPQEVEDRLFEALGRPANCPHGFPIPGQGSDGVPQMPHLYDLEPGQQAVVALSSSVSEAMVEFLSGMGLVPDAQVEVLEKQPFGGPLVVRVAGVDRVLGERAGRQVRVRTVPGIGSGGAGPAPLAVPSLGSSTKEKV
ncbi:MAG TPA: metal-dependent transcriptional regulator [Acidimicrobiales bacterium]|nr:metal-dependent transcriptional regulator [Acidimicrobiales bacterium]